MFLDYSAFLPAVLEYLTNFNIISARFAVIGEFGERR